MRKRDRASHFNLSSLPYPPHRAAEIAESINRDNGGFLKGRGKERARQVCAVMLDEVDLPGFGRDNSLVGQNVSNFTNFQTIYGTRAELQPSVRTHGSTQQLASQ